ncbi:MAG: hypothetical protein ACR2K5_11815 [Pseudolabrys sp.]
MAVAPASPLAMTLRPTMKVRLCQFFKPALAFVVVAALLFILLQWNVRCLLLPLTLIGLAVVVMIGNDATLLGGLRPFDGGDDGLVYDGWSRIIVQQLLNGDIVGALKGVEPVFVFTPGSRYLRAVEHLIFGESYFGYVSLLLLLPFLVFCLFRRYLTARAALAVTLIFVAFPIGALFGSTFYLYVKHAAHGYGDPAAAVFFIAATLGLIGCARSGPSLRFGPALRSGLLFALALFVRPNLAIGAAILLGGAGLAALWQLQYRRLAGLCVGFLPVFGATLHNWYYGGAFVLFSTQTSAPASMPMPPYAYGSALWELLHLNFSGNVARGGRQILLMLVGPSESFAMAPLYAVALVIIVRVTMSARFDNWLRLIAIGTLGLYTPALFFIYSDRYLLVAWLFTLLICFVWLCDEGLPWIERRYPGLVDGVLRRRGAIWLSRWLDTFARACGVLPPAAISAK